MGWLLVTIVVREVGPVWAAFFVLLHSGSAITVELGTMSVSREVESLKMVGIDPYRFLGVPRFWGVTFSLMVLYVICMFSAIVGGYLFAQVFIVPVTHGLQPANPFPGFHHPEYSILEGFVVGTECI